LQMSRNDLRNWTSFLPRARMRVEKIWNRGGDMMLTAGQQFDRIKA